MNISREKKIKLIDNLVDAHNAVHKQLDILKLSLYPDPGCPLYSAVFELLETSIASTSAAIGDTATWLDWYIHDNDCGRRGHEAGYDNRLKPIRTVEDLLDLIEQGEE